MMRVYISRTITRLEHSNGHTIIKKIRVDTASLETFLEINKSYYKHFIFVEK